MQRYYWAAKAVTQLNQILLLNIEERLNPSGQRARADQRALPEQGRHDRGRQRRPVPERDPHAILETFLLYQTTVGVKGLSARTLRALYNARGVMDAQFRNDPVNHATFTRHAACSPRASRTRCG